MGYAVPLYRENDRLTDESGNVGYVREYTNNSTGQKFLRVKIIGGPRRGEFDAPWHFGPPVLDWTNSGQLLMCGKCYREFRTGLDAQGQPHDFCRQCQTNDDAAAKRIAADPSNGSRFAGANWKHEHRGTKKRT